jgi:hypothetical protein
VEQVTGVEMYPPGTRVVHIGPPKTGTTAVQSALFRRRAELASYGVAYPGRRRHERAAVSAVAFDEAPAGYTEDVGETDWERLARDIRTSTADRVVVSSEAFSFASDARLPRIVADLGGVGLQVVITARPLVSILPSRWQQSVQNYQIGGYEEWLERLFADGAEDDPQFGPLWRRLRVDQLIERWGAHVGEENVTVIVLDPADRSMLLGTFEKLLGLPDGFLVPASVKGNESLPYPEVETLRAFNRRFREEGHSHAMYVRAIRKRAMRDIKAAGLSSERPHPIGTPGWAAENARLVSDQMIEAIRSSGARVIGALSHLVGDDARDHGADVPTTVAVESAAEIAYAMFRAGLADGREPTEALGPAPVDEWATRVLVGELGRRLRDRVQPGRS